MKDKMRYRRSAANTWDYLDLNGPEKDTWGN
jgi:hypothetical protein